MNKKTNRQLKFEKWSMAENKYMQILIENTLMKCKKHLNGQILVIFQDIYHNQSVAHLIQQTIILKKKMMRALKRNNRVHWNI